MTWLDTSHDMTHDMLRHNGTPPGTTPNKPTWFIRLNKHHTARNDTTWQNKWYRHDTTKKHDTTWYDTTRHDTTGHDTPRHDMTRQDNKQHGWHKKQQYIWHDTMLHIDTTWQNTTCHLLTWIRTAQQDMSQHESHITNFTHDATRFDKTQHAMPQHDTAQYFWQENNT